MATVVALGVALAVALALWKVLAPWKVRARTRINRSVYQLSNSIVLLIFIFTRDVISAVKRTALNRVSQDF